MKNFPKNKNYITGFTLMEILIAMSILILIVTISVPAYGSVRDNIALKNDSQEMLNALRTAQNESIVSKNDLAHGVYFATSTYHIYSGSWPTISFNTEHSLSGGIEIISGNNTHIEFDRLTGQTSSSTIIIAHGINDQKIINIENGGNIYIE